jgi:hypothetical protein
MSSRRKKRRPGSKQRIRKVDPNTDGLAKKMLGHFVPYEVAMMRALHRKLQAGSPTQLDRNADIESYHVHARNLIEFFTDDIQCAIDPRAFTTTAYRIDGNFIPKKLETKISQQIVHLTHERTDVTADKLSDEERDRTTKAIEKAIKRFENALRPEWRLIWRKSLDEMKFDDDVDAAKRCFRYVSGPTGPPAPPSIDVPANQVLGPTNQVTSSLSGPSPQVANVKGPPGSTASQTGPEEK